MHRPMALLLIIAGLAVLPSDAPITALGHRAPVSRAMTVAITKGRIRLSLQLKGTAFPRNALVLTTVRLSNHTGRTISTWDCLRSSLGAEVVRPNSVGTFYPPLLTPPGAPWSGCPGEMGMGGVGMRQMIRIPAGQTLTRMTYVVLRAFTVRGWTQLMVRAGEMKPILIQTPPIRIRETAAFGPAVRIRMGPPISARVTPVPGAGPILYSEYASCRGRTPNEPFNASATFSRWSRASGTVLHPFKRPCASLSEWVIFVSQVGRPIARAYYCAQHGRCVYAPPTRQERAIVACKVGAGKALIAGRLPRSAARYAIGLSSILPAGLSATQQALAKAFHARCAPLLARHRRAP